MRIHLEPAQVPKFHWRRLNRAGLALASGYSLDFLEKLFEDGLLEIHLLMVNPGERITDTVAGTLALYFAPEGAGGTLTVMWVETKRGVRWDRDWLWEAASYLRCLARVRGCSRVVACVNLGRPDRRWRERLEQVGFQPEMVQLSMPLDEEVFLWPQLPESQSPQSWA